MNRPPDDDAPTPPFPRARSQSGEIVRDDAAPEHSDDEYTPAPFDLVDDDPRLRLFLERIWKHVDSAHRRAENRVLEVQAAVQRQVTPERSSPVKRWGRDIVVGLLTVVASSILALVFDGYRAARAELNAQHDQLLVMEQRVSATERTLAAVIVPRISPTLLQPGQAPGKDSTP